MTFYLILESGYLFFGYSGTRSVFDSVPVRFPLFGFRNLRIIRIFESFGSVSVSGNLIRFRFSFSVPVFLPRANFEYKLKKLHE